MRKYISSVDFTKKPDLDAIVVKAGLMAAVTETNDRQLRFVISNEDRDRSGDIVKLTAWDLNAYYRNPVVLFDHDASRPPVAKCVQIGIVGNNLVATAEFAPANTPVIGELAECLFQQCRSGFLNATSVGFRVLDYTKQKDEAGGSIYNAIEMVEWSVVVIPDLPSALLIDTQPVKSHILNNARRQREIAVMQMRYAEI